MTISEILDRVSTLRRITRTALSKVETSSARIMTIEDGYNRLSLMSIKQDDLFRQALRCVENELYRAAHVMAWAAFIDYLQERLSEDGFIKLRKARPKWKLISVEDLRDQSDFQLIEAASEISFLKKAEKKALFGLLNRRNECAHPEDFYPGINESLGYLSELIKRIDSFKLRSLCDVSSIPSPSSGVRRVW